MSHWCPDLGIPDDVHVLQVDFDFGIKLDDPSFDVLSSDERCRALRFVHHADAIRFATSRTMLRNCLATAINESAASIQFAASASGRPMLYGDHTRSTIDFNISHSGDHALITWSRKRKVGVDIEFRRHDLGWESLVDKVLGSADTLQLANTVTEHRRALFFDIWVAKEALLKAEGSGIGAGLTGFSVASGNHRLPVVHGINPIANTLRKFRACWLRSIEGYAACLAWSD